MTRFRVSVTFPEVGEERRRDGCSPTHRFPTSFFFLGNSNPAGSFQKLAAMCGLEWSRHGCPSSASHDRLFRSQIPRIPQVSSLLSKHAAVAEG
jgi:hypothetical protein